ncbi:hypothetical protein L226DRAFT_46290 [Lentinus tigrinus ALCF2SS1-7]|uniref:uncharacterized protein n=1 Tax=Lentinus tigrinus ALCF2SS1-7 TaxID=1328758 RepID=UPI0011662D9D|nr:hypothetical protein L226DRAFT_46290 [Lentinus tigrinus ALCF2SS1-7]
MVGLIQAIIYDFSFSPICLVSYAPRTPSCHPPTHQHYVEAHHASSFSSHHSFPTTPRKRLQASRRWPRLSQDFVPNITFHACHTAHRYTVHLSSRTTLPSVAHTDGTSSPSQRTSDGVLGSWDRATSVFDFIRASLLKAVHYASVFLQGSLRTLHSILTTCFIGRSSSTGAPNMRSRGSRRRSPVFDTLAQYPRGAPPNLKGA